MKQKLITITPQMAREFLKKNNRNRPVYQAHVDFLASEMTGARWATTHQGICFSEDGLLLDGQHRLLAIVQSGCTVEMWVSTGYDPAAQSNMDVGGRGRTVGDQLHLVDGTTNAKTKAAAATHIVTICCACGGVKVSVGLARSVLTEFERDIDYVLLQVVHFKPARCGWAVGTLAFIYNAERALKPFVDGFGSGEDLKKGDPAKAARDWLTNADKRKGYKKTAAGMLMNAAWHALNGSTINLLKAGTAGPDYFAGKKRKFIQSIREQLRQQLDTTIQEAAP